MVQFQIINLLVLNHPWFCVGFVLLLLLLFWNTRNGIQGYREETYKPKLNQTTIDLQNMTQNIEKIIEENN